MVILVCAKLLANFNNNMGLDQKDTDSYAHVTVWTRILVYKVLQLNS